MTIGYKGGWTWDWSKRGTDVSLNGQVLWDVEIAGGAGKLQGKFATVDLRSFRLTGGVDNLRLTLGRPTGDVPIELTRGVNNIRIEHPTGVLVRLRLDGRRPDRLRPAAGRRHGRHRARIQGRRRVSDRHLVDITGGAGKVTITEVD